tara:strand:- start:32 stop:535 length:504 start_codon:yes stop_codon:yes gene_type:complete
MFKLILITFLSTLCISFAQEVNLSDISNLSEDGKKEYFRNYLNVKAARFGKSTYNGWVVYQGLDKQLTTKEFFSLVGYQPEDVNFSKRTKWPWKLFRNIGILGGLSMVNYVEEGPPSEKPLMAPGILFLGGGFYSLYFLIKNPQLMLYDTAKQIADDYNKTLVKRIK